MKHPPTKLYIIGNGFDLHHKLKTSYHDFLVFFKDQFPEEFELLNLYFERVFNQNGSLTSFWSDVEMALSKFDFEEALEDKKDYIPNLSDDDWNSNIGAYEYEMNKICEALDFKGKMTAFIRSITPLSECVFKNVKISSPLDKEAKYLVFNYTDTVERYGVPEKNILHIHGNVDDIIFGHGIDPKIFEHSELVDLPTGLSPEAYNNWLEEQSNNYDFSYELGRNLILTYFRMSYKDTASIIECNNQFFQSLTNIDTIFILGHSLGDIDSPYFDKVFQKVNPKAINCYVSYFSNEEMETHKEILSKYDIPEDRLNFRKLEELLL